MQTIDEKQINGKWWRYNIDDKTIDGIKNQDRYYIRKFYEDNEQLIKCIALHFYNSTKLRCNNNRLQYSVDDMIAQIYVDLPLYKYESSRTLYGGMRYSCLCVDVGGYVRRGYAWNDVDHYITMSLDKVLTPDGKDFTLYKMLAAPDTCEEKVVDGIQLGEWFKFEKLIDKLAVELFPNDTYMQDKFIRSV